MVFSRELPALVGLFVGFSTLKEYGVEKVFVLENRNTDSSQRNIVYIVDSENPITVQAVASKCLLLFRNIEYKSFASRRENIRFCPPRSISLIGLSFLPFYLCFLSNS